jgi:hypothetical protein
MTVIILILPAVFAVFPRIRAKQHRAYRYAPPARVYFGPSPFVHGINHQYNEYVTHKYLIRFINCGRFWGGESGGAIPASHTPTGVT